MSAKIAQILVPVCLAAAAAVTLTVWLRGSDGRAEVMRIPTSLEQPAEAASTSVAPMRGELVTFSGVPAAIGGSWPCFRGAEHDGISKEALPLSSTWPATGPRALWSIALGEGYAGAAVRDGRVYVLDYDAKISADALRCLSLADGRDIWRYSYAVKVKRNHGMSRTVPAVSDKYVVTLGPKCHVLCLDAKEGAFRWSIDLVRQYGATVPLWYAGQCPLIDSERAILAPCGPEALMIAVDCATGKVLWKTPNPSKWVMTHSSIVPVEFEGRRIYLYCGSGGIAGVSAEDGKVLFTSDAWKITTATVPTPVVLPGGRVFCSGGYNAGSVMFQLRRHGNAIVPEVLFRLKASVFGATQQTPVFYKGYLYGIGADGRLVCLDPQGAVVWTSTAEDFGLGPLLVADDKIFVAHDVVGDNASYCELVMAAATSEGYRPLARAKIFKGSEAWGPMAIAGGRLILRDLTRMVCLDLAAPTEGAK